ncbi:MAG: Crp/Fnr family transcriptional regulator [Acidobacteria bacterium]|nr:Crp/Fnr family transcriptional regulator [Acidobacteriota bacterium]
MLFVEGQASKGIWIICEGRVKLTVTSPFGQARIIRTATAGEALGLSSAVLGSSHPLNAETMSRCSFRFLKRLDFVRLIREHTDLRLSVARHLGQQYITACQVMGSLGVPQSASERLAGLFLNWAGEQGGDPHRAHVDVMYTHEEVAQIIGTTRETVSRLLRKFKQKQLIELNGSSLTLCDPKSLAAVSSGSYDIERGDPA